MARSPSVYGAASVIGGIHSESGVPNQDAYLVRNYAFGTVMTVADGLGSKPLAHIGSKTACASVSEAAKIWSRQAEAPAELLIRLIHAIWELRIFPNNKADCGTTCLFAVVTKSGRLICGQLGDGLIGYRTRDLTFRMVDDKTDEFSNLTQALHTTRSISDWKWFEERVDSEPFGLMLATDGISEDLVPDKRGDFLQYLNELIARKQSKRSRSAAIRQLLLNWTAKHSYDDKTLVVYYRGAENDEELQ